MPSTTWVKICGLATAEAVSAAVLGGADAVGFVLASGSPRTVSPEHARTLVELVPDGVETVGVFRAQPAHEVIALASAAGIKTVQLHGDETPATVEAVIAAGFPVIRALSAGSFAKESHEQRARFGHVRLLLDAPSPGAGATFEASTLEAAPPVGDWVLAGGLNPDNVASLSHTLRPTGVDVSSGVESSRGVKDPALIRDFIAAARS